MALFNNNISANPYSKMGYNTSTPSTYIGSVYKSAYNNALTARSVANGGSVGQGRLMPDNTSTSARDYSGGTSASGLMNQLLSLGADNSAFNASEAQKNRD